MHPLYSRIHLSVIGGLVPFVTKFTKVRITAAYFGRAIMHMQRFKPTSVVHTTGVQDSNPQLLSP
jgi:hypothetical protein